MIPYTDTSKNSFLIQTCIRLIVIQYNLPAFFLIYDNSDDIVFMIYLSGTKRNMATTQCQREKTRDVRLLVHDFMKMLRPKGKS